ncbi:hypothetical protein N8T08_011022 [Aspergillus melleus]|uniref:Uncharacterized protein n=1 Tax=Aspergillus melleus TaxID=138277 RepID=A0ACC3AQC4_9EURO|nr:hypothetical protein N8T08_011022 [Aspergillus melleus]
MSSPSVQVQPQPSTKGVVTPDTGPKGMNFDIVRCSRCQRSMSLENESSPGVPGPIVDKTHATNNIGINIMMNTLFAVSLLAILATIFHT